MHLGNSQSWGQLSSTYTKSFGSATRYRDPYFFMSQAFGYIYFCISYMNQKKEEKMDRKIRLTASKTTPAFIYYSSPSCNFQSFNYNLRHFLWLFNRLHQTRNEKKYISLFCFIAWLKLNSLIAYEAMKKRNPGWRI